MSETRVERGVVASFGVLARGTNSTFRGRESTLRCKLDSQLNWAAVRNIFWVGGKWIMQIPVQIEGIPKSFVYDRQGALVAQAIDMRTQKQFLEMLAQAGLK